VSRRDKENFVEFEFKEYKGSFLSLYSFVLLSLNFQARRMVSLYVQILTFQRSRLHLRVLLSRLWTGSRKLLYDYLPTSAIEIRFLSSSS